VAEMARKRLKFLQKESKLLKQRAEYEANVLIQKAKLNVKENAY
jgi:hypothetical protein